MAATRSRARATAALSAATVALALLAGCTTGGQPDDTATSRRDPAFARFSTDPDVPVVSDLVYGRTDDGAKLLADVCLPPTGPDEDDGQVPADEAGDPGDGDADADATATATPAPTSGPDGAAPADPADGTGTSASGTAATGDSTPQPDPGDAATTDPADADEVPDDATPGILMVHGGGWARGDKATLPYRATCQWLAKATGFPVVTIDYRLAPAHPFPAAWDDVQTAVQWMRQPEQVQRFHIDPDRIGAFGGSAGGNLVALLGATGSGGWDTGSRIAAVVDLSGPVDLTGADVDAKFVPTQLSYTGCEQLEGCAAAEAASVAPQLDRTDPPFLVAHAVEDPLIQYAQSTTFVKRLRSKGIDTTFVKVEGGAHSIAMLSGNDRLRARIVQFLTSHLTGAG